MLARGERAHGGTTITSPSSVMALMLGGPNPVLHIERGQRRAPARASGEVTEHHGSVCRWREDVLVMEAAGSLSAVKMPPGARARQTAVKPPAGPRLRLARLGLARPQNGGCSVPGHSDPTAFTSRVPSPGSTFTSILCSHAPGTSPGAEGQGC